MRLTTENVALINTEETRKKGLRASSSPSPSRSDESGSDTTVSTTDVLFGQIARHNGILDHDSSIPPTNLKDIQLFLAQKRDSPDPGKTEFTDYERDVKRASNEISTVLAVTSGILQKSRDPLYTGYPNQHFANFPTNVGFNDGLSAARPDWIEGYLKDAFENNSIVERLDGVAVQTSGKFPIVLAHLAGEFKRRGGNMVCGSDQAAYDAAYLVYGRKQAQVLMHKADESGKAYVGSFVCDGQHLQISVHYTTKHPTSGATEYRQYLMFDENIQRDLEHFINGRRHLRNLQDFSRRNANMIREPPKDHKQEKRKTPHRACKGRALRDAAKVSDNNVEG